MDGSDLQRFKRLKSFELTYQEFEKLADHAREAKLAFIATPFDLSSAEFTGHICDAIKIASGDNNFVPLIDAVAQIGKPTILSTGLLGADQLITPYSRLAGTPARKSPAVLRIMLPSSERRSRPNPKEKFECDIGYSDHTTGLDACFTAVCCGARIIEKHFTLAHDYSDFEIINYQPTHRKCWIFV